MSEKVDPRTGPVEVVPTKQGWTASQIAGVVVGAALFGIIAGCLLGYGIVVGWKL